MLRSPDRLHLVVSGNCFSDGLFFIGDFREDCQSINDGLGLFVALLTLVLRSEFRGRWSRRSWSLMRFLLVSDWFPQIIAMEFRSATVISLRGAVPGGS